MLYAGVSCGADLRPYFVKTPFQPRFELDDATRLAGKLGVKLEVVSFDILSVSEVTANPANRCYFCKRALFGLLKSKALQDGFLLLLDGTNASDDVNDRPGMQALQELSVRSPLRECGLTKDEIRRRSRKAGLFTWNKPSYACLATRIPMGEPVTAELLSRVEHAENELFALGFSDFRVRVFHGAARVQLPASQIASATSERTAILERLAPYFATVFLDLKERSEN